MREILYRLGKCFWHMKELTQAEEFYNHAVAKSYISPQVNWEMARLHQDIALQKLEEGFAKYPDSKDI